MKPKFNFQSTIKLSCATITTVLVLMGLTSCDPLKHVIVLNQTKEHVTVQIEQDTTSFLTFGRESLLEYRLSASGDSSQIRWIYGFGKFSKEELSAFNSMVKKITITKDGEKRVISDTDLKGYLPKRRGGIMKNSLKLKIKNCP